MSNMGLDRFLAGMKLKLERAPVGDRYVIEQMRKGGFNVGGEQSGHIVLNDFSTTGDGLVAALQVLAVLAADRKPASEATRLYEPMPQVLENVQFRNGSPLEDAKVKSHIEASTLRLNGKGRLIVRKSGTERVIRIMAEGEDEGELRDVVRGLAEVVRDAGI
jgi:phosphoglucosamine mutase